MREIDKSQLQTRMNNLAINSSTAVNVPELVSFFITGIQKQLPYADLGKRLIPYVGDAILTCLESMQSGKNDAPTICLKTVFSDVVECASNMDMQIDTTSSKWREIRQDITQLINSTVLKFKGYNLSEIPKEDKPAIQKGTLDIRIAERIAGKSKSDINIDDIIDNAEWKETAGDINADYVAVLNPVEYRGVWRVNGRRTVMLTDCFIKVVKQITPDLDSNTGGYMLVLQIIDRNNQEHTLSFTNQHKIDGTFASKLRAVGRYPNNKTHQTYFDDCLDMMSRHETVIQQKQKDSLGWHTHNGKRVYLLSNGCETIDGFLDGDKAPFLAPTLPANINGYKGAMVNAPTDEIMELLLNQLNIEIFDILAGLLGISAYIMTPDTIYDGVIRFVMEIMGKSRRGKSVCINFFLSLFGIDFKYNSATQLNIDAGLGKGNTSLGDLGLLSMFKYMLYSDSDYKVKADSIQDDKLKNRRDAINLMIADNASGGVTSTKYGGLRFRGNPYGAMLRQGNQDYAVKHPDEVLEGRVSTFIWNDDAFSNDYISKQIDKQREKIYSWGYAYRMWIASKPTEELKVIINETYDTAYETVNAYTWYRDLHQQHTIILLNGLLLWRTFLCEMYPNSFMVAWIDTHITDLINSRLQRNKYIYEDIQHVATTEQANKIVDIIRSHLLMRKAHIKSANNRFLKTDSSPVNTEFLGYSNDRGYKANGVIVGYLIHKKETDENSVHIAFDTLALLPVIEKSLKEYGLSTDMTTLLKMLAENNYILIDKPHYRKLVRIAGKQARYMVMPFNVLFPTSTTDDNETPFNDGDEFVETSDKIKHIDEAPSKRKDTSSDSAILAIASDD